MNTASTKVRYVLGTTGKVMRVEPWSIVFTETGNRRDPQRGRRPPRANRALWIAKRPQERRERVRLVAMDMSAEFRKAVREALPEAKVSVDHFYVVALSNRMVTAVRLRRSHETVGRRGG